MALPREAMLFPVALGEPFRRGGTSTAPSSKILEIVQMLDDIGPAVASDHSRGHVTFTLHPAEIWPDETRTT
jgi:hypothetical protein